jgi:hypothetical protein
VTNTIGFAGSRWALQAEGPVQSSVAASTPAPTTPTPAASVVTHAPSSISTSVTPVLAVSGKQVLNEQKVKVVKNFSATVFGEIILYKTDNHAIAVFLEVHVLHEHMCHNLWHIWIEANANNLQIVVNGSSKWNAPIEDQDLIKLVGSFLTVSNSIYVFLNLNFHIP